MSVPAAQFSARIARYGRYTAGSRLIGTGPKRGDSIGDGQVYEPAEEPDQREGERR
jgi:hypothetical protein